MLSLALVKAKIGIALLQSGASSIMGTIMGYIPLIIIIGVLGYIMSLLKKKT